MGRSPACRCVGALERGGIGRSAVSPGEYLRTAQFPRAQVAGQTLGPDRVQTNQEELQSLFCDLGNEVHPSAHDKRSEPTASDA